MIEKPECDLCRKEESGIEQLAEDLLYSLFNPYHKERGEFNVSDFIKEHIDREESRKDYEIFKNTFNEVMKSFGFMNMYWLDRLEEFRQAKTRAWQELKEMLRKGELSREDVSPSDIVDNFLDEVVEELTEMGYIERCETRFHRKIVYYSKKAEKVLADKVLALSLQNLDKKSYGEHETDKPGVSIYHGEKLVEFDPFVHTFDSLDIVESLIKSAVRGEIEFIERELVARQPKHSERCVYVMLIDVSDSMRGRKMIGAIEAALALKRAIKKRGSSDELRVVAFNHKVREIKHGEILNLEARGRTDIGLALRKAREIISRSEGTGMVFLISDGEPTSSFNPYLTPWRCSLKEAENLKKVDARLQIIMFGKEGRFLEFCKAMAKVSGRANVFHFSDPLNLKRFVVKSYMRFARG